MLSERERRLLDFERSWWQRSISKQVQIRTELGLSPGAYYAAMRSLVSRGDALEYDPLLVRRLRRKRDQRRRARYENDPGRLRRRGQ
jgi:DNA-binding MarR family transcriptional regulator